MRLAILTDAHANLPALRAALAAVDRFAPDLTVHTGDAIGTGPYPRECLELLLARPATRCLMGNHDEALEKRGSYFNDAAQAAIDLAHLMLGAEEKQFLAGLRVNDRVTDRTARDMLEHRRS